MSRAAAFIAVLLFTIVAGITPVFAEKRVALVIGNSTYEHAQSLNNPQNDARLIAAILEKRGFEVDLRIDLDYKNMKRAIRSFTSKLQKQGEDTAGLFFYAGHGLQSRGQNFLVPVDAEIEAEGDIEIETIASDGLLSGMQFAGNRLNIVILDACRNNPYRGLFRSSTRGLARMDAPVGSMVAFSTSPGTVAADGAGNNSPYTAALAKAMAIPGLKIEDVFKRVRQTVYASTKGRQVPWESTSIFGDFFFTAPLPKETVSTPDTSLIEQTHWEAIQYSRTPEPFQAYLTKYPDGIFAAEARQRLADLKRLEQVKTKAEERAKADAAERLRLAEQARTRLNVERARLAKEREDFATRLTRLEAQAQAREKLAAAKQQEENEARAERDRLAKERADYQSKLEKLEARAEKLAAQVEANAEERKVASLATDTGPNATDTSATSALDGGELAFVLQAELKRVGCEPGPIDGQWGGKSRAALSQFSAHAKVKLASTDPSLQALEAVKSKQARVCPVRIVKPPQTKSPRRQTTTKKRPTSAKRKKASAPGKGKCGSGPCTSTATFPSGKKVIIQTVPNAVANW